VNILNKSKLNLKKKKVMGVVISATQEVEIRRIEV
jgi:hypothetical protein